VNAGNGCASGTKLDDASDMRMTASDDEAMQRCIMVADVRASWLDMPRRVEVIAKKRSSESQRLKAGRKALHVAIPFASPSPIDHFERLHTLTR
jgi:hypothetical protein